MKQILRWLGANIYRVESVTNKASDADELKPVHKDVEKGVLLPDIHVLKNEEDTVPNLSTLSPSVADSDEAVGFNPYDTGVLRKD